MIGAVKQFAGLLKVRIALAVVLSAAVGYLVLNGQVDDRLVWLSVGVFLLAAGSAAINQIQEIGFDAKMQRTAGRALPAGLIEKRPAVLLALALSMAGVAVLWITCGWLPAALGLFTLLWYNLVYTPLKPYTPFALIIGALVGAVPPAIGFSAAGGSLSSETLWLLAGFYFVWQVPHFLLLLLRYGDEYVRAGFRPLSRYLSIRQMAMLTFVWIVALVAAGAFLTLSGLIRRELFVWLQILVSIAFVAVAVPLLNPAAHERHIPRMFRIINGFMLLMSHFLMLDQIF